MEQMIANGIERNLLREVRNARPEECKAIIAALCAMEGRKDAAGRPTPLGYLAASLIEELAINGIAKMKFGKADCVELRRDRSSTVGTDAPEEVTQR